MKNMYDNECDHFWNFLRKNHKFSMVFKIDENDEKITFESYTIDFSSKPDLIKGHSRPHIGLFVSIPRLNEHKQQLHSYRGSKDMYSSTQTTKLLNKLVDNPNIYKKGYEYFVSKIITKLVYDIKSKYNIDIIVDERHYHPFFEPIYVELKI